MKFVNEGQAKRETGLSYLGGISISSKIMKNQTVSHNYTYILYLAPARESGYNVCSHSTPECRMACLATSGRAKLELRGGIDKIKNARIKKTKLFFEEQDFFMDWLISELKRYELKAKKDGYFFSVRLNGTSDIDWNTVYHNGKNVFELFPNVQFYDYTKNPEKYNNVAPNYHLTFSYTGYNTDKCLELLSKGVSVSVVFDIKNGTQLPKTFHGYNVIDGDITDVRFWDKNVNVVGLKFKSIADKSKEFFSKRSVFVVSPDNQHCIH